jgi:hypothetical protein
MLTSYPVVVLSSLTSLGITVLLGERLDLSSIENLSSVKGHGSWNGLEERVVRTLSAREICTDLIVRTIDIHNLGLYLMRYHDATSYFAQARHPTPTS